MSCQHAVVVLAPDPVRPGHAVLVRSDFPCARCIEIDIELEEILDSAGS